MTGTHSAGEVDIPLNSSPRKLGGATNWEGQKSRGDRVEEFPKTRRGNSTKNPAPPRISKNLAPPKIRQKKGQWIELKPGTVRKDGTRMYYPKYRRWKAGNKKKEWAGSVPDLDPMTESEKINYVNKNKRARKLRKQRKNRKRND